MDFVSLAGFLMTICHLALQIRGEEGESKFDFFLRGHMKYAMKFRPITTCLTKLEEGNFGARSSISEKSSGHVSSCFRAEFHLPGL